MEGLSDFKTAYGEKIGQGRLIKEIEDFVLADDKFEYKILVGTDSEIQREYDDFVTVIVVHRVGCGARYFWRRSIVKKNFDLYQRLWQETLLSLDIGRSLLALLIGIRGKFRFELHLDIGTTGKSRSVVKELTNLVRSYGVEFKIKPEAYAASKIADRLI